MDKCYSCGRATIHPTQLCTRCADLYRRCPDCGSQYVCVHADARAEDERHHQETHR